MCPTDGDLEGMLLPSNETSAATHASEINSDCGKTPTYPSDFDPDSLNSHAKEGRETCEHNGNGKAGRIYRNVFMTEMSQPSTDGRLERIEAGTCGRSGGSAPGVPGDVDEELHDGAPVGANESIDAFTGVHRMQRPHASKKIMIITIIARRF